MKTDRTIDIQVASMDDVLEAFDWLLHGAAAFPLTRLWHLLRASSIR